MLSAAAAKIPWPLGRRTLSACSWLWLTKEKGLQSEEIRRTLPSDAAPAALGWLNRTSRQRVARRRCSSVVQRRRGFWPPSDAVPLCQPFVVCPSALGGASAEARKLLLPPSASPPFPLLLFLLLSPVLLHPWDDWII